MSPSVLLQLGREVVLHLAEAFNLELDHHRRVFVGRELELTHLRAKGFSQLAEVAGALLDSRRTAPRPS